MKIFGWHPWCNLKWKTLEYWRYGIVGSYKHRRVTCIECDYSSDLYDSKSYDENWRSLKEGEK